MTSVGQLWYLAEEAGRRAEETYHDLVERHDEVMEPEFSRRVGRRHFRRAVERGRDSGAAYGVHTIVYRPSGELCLVRHDDVGQWVLPGGEVGDDETFREAAAREVGEEAGVAVDYDGLAMLMRVDIRCDDNATSGVVPVYAAEAREEDLEVSDPDGEITDAQWFDELPADTRDREHLRAWREQRFDEE
jgi:8-oxo-dGTP pyrophosphatase MutT (NUDIX family)